MVSILLKGKLTFYPVKMPEAFQNNITGVLPAIKNMAFKDISKDTIHNLSVGWVDPIDSYDTEIFRNHVIGSYYVFGVRIDTYKFSKAQIQPVYDRVIGEYKRNNNIEYVPKHEKISLQNHVMRHMRAKALPQTRLEYVVFDYISKHIYILASSESVISKVLTLLQNTFDITDGYGAKIAWDKYAYPYTKRLAEQTQVSSTHIRALFMNWLLHRASTAPDFSVNGDSWVFITDTTINFKNGDATVMIKCKTHLDENKVAQDIIGEQSTIELKKVRFNLIKNNQDWTFTISENSLTPVAIDYFDGKPVEPSIIDRVSERLDNLLTFRQYMDRMIDCFADYYKQAQEDTV